MAYDFSKMDIEVLPNNGNTTAFAGLIPFMDMWDAMGMPSIIDDNLGLRKNKGYADSEHIKTLILMQLAGGEVPEHVKFFKEKFDLKDFPLPVPSPSATRAWLDAFHNPDEDEFRKKGHVYIPKENPYLAGFFNVHLNVLKQAYLLNPLKTITLDQDATFIETSANGALCNYHGQTSYEALNLYCPEYDIVAGTQFRDGNVNPGYGQLEQLKKVLSCLPSGIEKVQFRSDSAGYQIDFLKYLSEKKMDFAISCPMREDLRAAAHNVPEEEWKIIEKKEIINGCEVMRKSTQEWAEVAYVPASLSTSKEGPVYRFLVTRERYTGETGEKGKPEETSQLPLPLPEMIEDMEKANPNLRKLHLTDMNGKVYKVFGIVTNRLEEDGGAIIRWYRERCGKSEEIHRILKEELGGGHIVSKNFGANAAWWNIAVLALSLNNMFKHNFLPKEAETKRPKGLRYMFYTQIGELIKHARRLILRIREGKASEWFEYARGKLMSFRAVAN